jgi:prophage DNA circulation protein
VDPVTWREDLRRVVIGGRRLVGASFRGVPFFVKSSDRTGGRRVVTHEFPGKDANYNEDLGRKARTFRVDGYVIGDDYLAQKESLLDALENADGPGELVHPYYGLRTASCVTYSVRETTDEGGMATFAIDFADAPAQSIAPTIAPDFPDIVDGAATAAVTATDADFEAGFDDQLPSFATASAVSDLKAASTRVGETLKPVITDTQELAATDGQLHLLIAEASQLVTEPTTILTAFRTAFVNLGETLKSAPGQVKDALLAAARSVEWSPDAPETTATRQRERANQVALQGALRASLVIEAARIAPIVTYASIDDATAARDEITALLDELTADAGDAVYQALVELRAAVSRALPSDALHARVTAVTRRVAIPSLLLAYQLYGAVDMESDIIARNPITNPAFCVGDLQVLSDE